MRLTAQQVKNLAPGSRPQKFFDGQGLYLYLTKTGKYWRYKYRFAGKEKTLALGVYPDITLKKARADHQDARKQIRDGIDPSEVRAAKKRSSKEIHDNTFGDLAWEWFAKQQWSENHRKKQRGRLNNDVIPYLGKRPVGSIEPGDVLEICKRVEARGVIDGAHRVKTIISQIFRYAVAKKIIKSDPCRDLYKALTPYTPKNMAAITDPFEVGALLRCIDGYRGSDMVRLALRFAPLVFVRPGELRHSEWTEIDWNDSLWRIPAPKMKMKRPHIVPLAKQSIKILKMLEPLTGDGKYLFPSVRSKQRPMSDNTVNAALRRMGYTKEEITGHGFRSTASTLLHEKGYDTNIIEMQLAHKDPDTIRGAYNHAKYLPQRTKMMQAWADYLDELRDSKPQR